MSEITDKKIAVLIDADNVSDKYIRFILDELSNHGIPTYKRIYGDWTKPQLASWKAVLLENSITPIQQYSYTTGKNATDSALIIDAMDILYSNNVDGFCIVSSDSDFTRLATRLREAGMYVIGMGEKKTPMPFISACEKFKYLEVLASTIEEGQEPTEEEKKEAASAKPINSMKQVKLRSVLRSIVTEISDEDGWAALAEVGSTLNKRYSDFDTRNYGFTKLTPLIRSFNAFDIEMRPTGKANPTTNCFIRNKNKRNGNG